MTSAAGDAPPRIFISHAHADAALASAFKVLVERIFGRDALAVDFSSDNSPGGGIQAGTPWLDWILGKVQTADLVVVLLTPESLERPWLMWESGAATGIALAARRSENLIPMLLRVNRDDVTSPLSHLQAVQGDTEKGVRRAVQAVWSWVRAASVLDQATEGSVTTVRADLRTAEGVETATAPSPRPDARSRPPR